MADQWITPTDTYDRTVIHPTSGDEVAVTYRCLNTGEVAKLSTLDVGDGGGSAELRAGTRQLLATSWAVVKWDIPHPPTLDVMKQLRPDVFAAISEFVSIDGEVPPEVIDDLDRPTNNAAQSEPNGTPSGSDD